MNRWAFISLAALFFVQPMTASAEETTGTVRAVHADKSQIDLKGVISDSIYDVNKDAKVCIDGKKAALKDLQEKDRVTIVYTKSGDRMLASEVRALRNASETTGTVQKVNTTENNLILKGTLSDTTYHLIKDAKVWIDDKEGQLSGIQPGDQVRIIYESRRNENPLANEVCVTKRK
jgi:Cu/Ag efflux protein CusF